MHAICERDDPLTSTCQHDDARSIKLDLHSEKGITGDTMRARTCQRGQKRSNFLMRIGVRVNERSAGKRCVSSLSLQVADSPRWINVERNVRELSPRHRRNKN